MTTSSENEPLRLKLSCIYATDQTWNEQYIQALRLGWAKTDLLRQTAAPFVAGNESFYRECAAIDATARGYDSYNGDYMRALVLTDHALRPYQSGKRPVFGCSPLADVPMPSTKGNLRTFNGFKVGTSEAAYLELACIVDNLSLSHVLSKILVWHFSKYWKKSYSKKLWRADNYSLDNPPTDYHYQKPNTLNA